MTAVPMLDQISTIQTASSDHFGSDSQAGPEIPIPASSSLIKPNWLLNSHFHSIPTAVGNVMTGR